MSAAIRFVAVALLLLLPRLAPVEAAEAGRAVAVVVAAQTGRALNMEGLALVYRRKTRFWIDGAKIIPVNLSATNPLRQQFSRVVLGSSVEDLERFWDDMYFHGESPPYVLSSEEAVLRFVARTPGAVGYVGYCNVDFRVKVVLVFTAVGRVGEDTARASCAR